MQKSDIDRHIERLERLLLTTGTGSTAELLAKANPREAARIAALIAGIAPVVCEYFAKQLLPIAQYLRVVEARVREIEDRGHVKVCGVYQPSAAYARGNLVTCDGALWHATREVAGQKPGTSDSWQLVAKSPGR